MYLASKSPQRKNILRSLGIGFETVVPDYQEEDPPGTPTAELVERHSSGKARSVLTRLSPLAPRRPILGVDTMVIIEGEALGKAGSETEALAYLNRLSGNTHHVYSGVSLIWVTEAGEEPRELIEFAATEVSFSAIPESELESYVATGEWRERAGAYAIQERASAFVTEIRGDYTNVVGLPVPLLVRMLREIGLWPPEGWSLD